MKQIFAYINICSFISISLSFFSLAGCYSGYWESYSGDPSKMTCFRKNIEKDMVQLSLAIKGTSEHFYIPFIWRRWVEQSPYSVEFEVTTRELVYEKVIVHSASLIKASGEVCPLLKKDKKVSFFFKKKNYTEFTQSEAFQANISFPNKIYIDYTNNKKIVVMIDISLVSQEKTKRIEIKAPFFAKVEKESKFIIFSYTD